MEITDKAYQDILGLVHTLLKEVEDLRKENALLKIRIHELEHPKNSNNSSIPPSKDENRPQKNKSLRIKSGKPSGGQIGHKGHNLEMAANPHKIIDHQPGNCTECGKSLMNIESCTTTKRQVVELPKIYPVYIEHRIHSKLCCCGHLNKAMIPSGVNSPIQYGDNIENLVAYLNIGQYLPYNRISSMLGSLFNMPLSQGSVKNMIEKFAKKSSPLYEKIRKEIEVSHVVGADETGAKMNGKKWWFWTWQNRDATYITASENRAYSTVESNFPNGFENATLISDRYEAHLKTKASAHQLCTSHLFRDLEYIIELTDSLRAKRLQLLLYDALLLNKEMEEEDYYKTNQNRNFIRKKTYELLDEDLGDEHKKVKTLFKKLGKSRSHIYEFLYNFNVPPDNNGSERAIRNVKVKQKVSTMFKTEQGINHYAIIRSIFDTCTKRGINIFDSSQLNLI
jgi:transposase